MASQREAIASRPSGLLTNYTNSLVKLKTKDGYVINSEYLKRYYSTIDAEIYFGNSFVDDVVNIQFQVQQNTMPLLGFNSYVFDEVAQGSRLIQGVFSINFTQPGYLYKILEAAKNTKNVYYPNIYTVTKAKEQTVAEFKSGEIIKAEKKPLWNTTFDIDIIYGQKTGKGNPVHVILEQVVLNGCSSGLDMSGNPVMETYNFLAKDIKTIEK